MKLSNREIFVTGLALLAMFFGAGNLIFPPMLGKLAGEDLWLAVFGFIVTGVGLPLLGVTAVAMAGGDLEKLGSRVNPLFGKIITTVVVLCIGPLLAIPRTCATTYEVGVAPFLGDLSPVMSSLALAVTTVIFFAIVLAFVLRPSQIIHNLGKILTPLLLLFLGIIIFKGIVSPGAGIGAANYSTPFIQGFLEGYNTMDALAATIFGLVIVNSVRNKGVTDNNEIAKITIIAGIVAAVGLGSVYIGLAYIGATTGILYAGDNQGELLSFMSEYLLGSFGKVAIAIGMALACLTTAIGLVASCGSFFSRLTNNRVSYNTICIIATLVSALLANMGLATILEVSVPLLVTVYPIVIALVLLGIIHNLFKGKKIVYVTTVGITTILALVNLAASIGQRLGIQLGLDKLLVYLPMHDQGLGWVVPALIVFVVGTLYSAVSQTQH